MPPVTKLKGIPRAPRELRGRGALPSLKNLQDKTPDELVRTLGRFGLEPDLENLVGRANRAFERVDELIANGQVPDEATLEAIAKGVEREVRGFLRQQVKAAIRNYKLKRMQDMGLDKFTWVALVIGSCDSCLARHGKTKTMAKWRKEGMPGSSVLLCGKECKCHLAPEVST